MILELCQAKELYYTLSYLAVPSPMESDGCLIYLNRPSYACAGVRPLLKCMLEAFEACLWAVIGTRVLGERP